MYKKNGMSGIGYAIVLVIVLGVIMIASAPMLVDKNNVEAPQEKTAAVPEPKRQIHEESNFDYEQIRHQIENLEDRLSSRISNLEMSQQQNKNKSPNSSLQNKYICSLEGSLDEEGNVIPLNEPNPDNQRNQKIVFVCEYI